MSFSTLYYSLSCEISFPFCFQYYESLLTEAKSKLENAISEAVERAVTSKMQDIQNKLEKCVEEKNAVADVSLLLISPPGYILLR